MVELIEYIDNTIKNCIAEVKQYGLCHLVDSDNEKFPATLEKKSQKASPDDRYLVCMYHRALSGSYDERDDLSFGKNPLRINSQKVRTVIFIKIGEDNRIDDIINAFPQTFETDNYYYAYVDDKMTLIRDAENTWNTEFQKSYADKYQKVWNVYALEWDLQYIKCNVCV